MTELMRKIAELVPSLEGWGSVEKSQSLAAMVIALRPNVSVEIGIYGGCTFFGLALAHKYLGHGMAWGIDPWTNEAACEGYEGANLEFWKSNPLEEIMCGFERKLLETGTQNVSKILRCKSDEAEVPPQIDILHIDGQHSEQAVKDVGRFAVNVRRGGICIMDDTGWENSGDMPVQRAVSELTKLGFVRLYPLGSGEVFQRI